MKKIFIVLLASILVGITIGWLLPTKSNEMASPLTADKGDVLAGLLACLTADVCQTKRTVEVVEGLQMLGVYERMPEKGMNIKYIFQTGPGAVTIVIAQDNQNQLSVYDTDLDGIVDMVIEMTDGKIVTFGPTDPMHEDDYRAAQALYEFALQTAWDRVIPEKLRKHLQENPDTDRYKS